MLSGFPDQAANDPQGYIAGLLVIAQLFTEDVLAIVVERSFPFLPSRYQWRQALEEEAAWQTRLRNMRQARAIELPVIEYDKPRYEPDPEPDPITGKHPPGTVLKEYQRWLGLYGKPRERP